MISKKATQQFLNRTLGSYDWIKKCTEQELDEALYELDPVPEFHTEPWIYQKACFLLLNELERFMIMLDMGMGKSKVCLDQISYQKQLGKNPRAMVLVPYISAIETWMDETEIHAPHLDCVPLLEGRDGNLDLIANEPGDLFVGQFQTVAAMLHHKKFTTTKTIEGKSSKKTKWDIKPDKIRKIYKDFNMLIVDESQKIANIHSLYYRIARAIGHSPTTERVYLLTGTPFGVNPEYLWAQFHTMDYGETLGETLGLFRSAFFIEKKNYWGGFDYKFNRNRKKDLYRTLKNRSIRYRDDECDDIPRKREIERHLDIPESTDKYADKVRKLLAEKAKQGSNYTEIKSNFMQLMQLSSGFMTFKGEDKGRIQVEFKENPKLDELMNLIDSIPKNRKVVVFHFFTHSNEVISKALTKAKIGHARVYGKRKDSIEEIRRFKKDPDCRVLVINSKSGSSSLNLQIANYVIWYEMPLSLIDFKQGIKRCWRRGQTRLVRFFFLIVRNTADQKLYNYSVDGQELFQAILDGDETL